MKHFSQVLLADPPQSVMDPVKPDKWLRMIKNSFADSRAAECFSSYIAVEAGNMKEMLAEVGTYS
jgi:hypothetical protein